MGSRLTAARRSPCSIWPQAENTAGSEHADREVRLPTLPVLTLRPAARTANARAAPGNLSRPVPLRSPSASPAGAARLPPDVVLTAAISFGSAARRGVPGSKSRQSGPDGQAGFPEGNGPSCHALLYPGPSLSPRGLRHSFMRPSPWAGLFFASPFPREGGVFQTEMKTPRFHWELLFRMGAGANHLEYYHEHL